MKFQVVFQCVLFNNVAINRSLFVGNVASSREAIALSNSPGLVYLVISTFREILALNLGGCAVLAVSSSVVIVCQSYVYVNNIVVHIIFSTFDICANAHIIIPRVFELQLRRKCGSGLRRCCQSIFGCICHLIQCI